MGKSSTGHLAEGGLDTEGASGLDSEPAGESLRSKDPAGFRLWKVERVTAPNADGANLESISG